MNRHFRDIDPLPRLTPVAKPKQAPSKPTWRLLGRPYLETDGRKMRYVPPEPARKDKEEVKTIAPTAFPVGSFVELPRHPKQGVGVVTAVKDSRRAIEWPKWGYEKTTESVEDLISSKAPTALYDRFKVWNSILKRNL